MRKPRFKAPKTAEVAYYHCISRVVNREFVLQDAEKEVLRRIMREYERFCGVRIITYCLMSNHFHFLVEVPKRPEAGLSDEELLDRLGAVYSKAAVAEIRKQLQDLADIPEKLAEYRETFFRRMWDVSEFMKAVKQRFTQWFNGKHGRRGTLWEERFRSVLVEGTASALSVMAAYIDLNGMRAGLVNDPKDYRWSGYGEAVAGNKAMEQALASVLPPGNEDLAAYRKLLYAAGAQEGIGTAEQPVRRGFSHEEVQAVWAAGGKLTLNELVRCRVRYFVDGAVLGSKGFVDSMFVEFRERFGSKRKDGARRLRGVATDELYSLRALRLKPIT